MKILLLSFSDQGGAGTATYRIYKMLLNSRLTIHYKVIKKNRIDKKILVQKPRIYFLNYLIRIFNINKFVSKIGNFKNRFTKDSSLIFTNFSNQINKSDYDIVHLTWINNFLSIEDIGKIKKPIVWTLCDMWPLGGVNHYDIWSEKLLWNSNHLKNKFKNFFNINYWAIKRKILSWNNKIYVVSPSKKLLSFANDSKILKKFSKNLIPWPIDKKNYYKKLNNYRKFFNLPTEKKLVIFACNNGIKDNRKGFDLFYESIKFSKNYYDVVILGSSDLENFSNIYKRKIYCFGKILDEKKIAKLLNSCDIIVIPSLIDNLPLIGIEAQACGLPIVTFDGNGVEDLVVHKHNGYLAKLYNVKDLAKGIDWTLGNLKKRNLSKNSIDHINKKCNPSVIRQKYVKLYKKILDNQNCE
jgi:glycosyltransferase involved in cell wall biosynthesis